MREFIEALLVSYAVCITCMFVANTRRLFREREKTRKLTNLTDLLVNRNNELCDCIRRRGRGNGGKENGNGND